jgi:glycosyltransferase involved in cell wall biosynthesis
LPPNAQCSRSMTSNTLRVAFLNQSGASVGGAERTLATFLANRPPDISPIVICFEGGAFTKEMSELGIEVRVIAASLALKSSTRERPTLAGTIAMLPVAWRLASLLRRERIDVLYTNTMKAHFIGALAGRIARVPCLMHFHDIVEGNALGALRFASRFGSSRRIACSNAVATWMGLPNTRAIYGPVDLTVFDSMPSRSEARAQLGLAADVPIVALIGRINRWKGHERFLRIAAEVLNSVDAMFLIVGSPIFRDEDFLDELRASAVKLQLTRNVRFLPWTEDVAGVYAAIDINANCSDREPFGRAVVEAAAAGVPSILFSDSGAAETILGDINGVVVPAGDEKVFANALLRMLERIRLSDYDERAIRETAKRYDARSIAAEMAEEIRLTALDEL